MLLDTIISIGENITTSPSGTILPDMKDLPFYEVVLEKEKDNAYLVTGRIRSPCMKIITKHDHYFIPCNMCV